MNVGRRPYLALLLALLLVAFGYVYCVAKDSIQLNRQGDAALFEQLIENVHAGRGAVSQVFAQTQNLIDRSYAGTSPVVLFESAISNRLIDPPGEERSMLGFHAYYILYPISLLLYLMSSSMALVVWQTAAYCALLWCACTYVYARGSGVLIALLFGVVVAVNPNWFLGIQGQFYPDRFFVIAGFVLMWMLHARVRLTYLLLASLFLMLLNERAALIGGLLMGMHGMLFGLGKHERLRLMTLVTIAGLLLGYAFLIKKYVLINAYYSTYMPADFSQLMDRLADASFSRGIVRNLANNGFLLVLALFSPRYLIIALIVLLPNLVGSIGGAEKVGWTTHYHSYYFPVLVFAAAAGASNLASKIQERRKMVWAGFGVLLIASLAAQQRGNLSEMGKPSEWLSSSLRQFWAYQTGEGTGYDIRKKIIGSFTPGMSIATNESGMAMLHQQYRVTPFPLGLARAEGVLVNCDELAQKVTVDAASGSRDSIGQVLEDKFSFDIPAMTQPFPGVCAIQKKKQADVHKSDK